MSEMFALKKRFVAECEKRSKFANLKVHNETQPTFFNLPFPTYHSLNIVTLEQQGRLNQTLH